MPVRPVRIAFYAATSAAIGAGLATALGHGLSRSASAGLLAGYAGLVGLGVAVPSTQIFADVISHVPDGVALTFDDGPDPTHTPKILDALDEGGAKATFFMIGRKMRAYPRVVDDVLRRGHAVGAHGYEHDRWYALRSFGTLERDADREERVWSKIVGRLPELFRPPIGLVNPRIARLADERGRAIVAWTLRARDGIASARADRVERRVSRSLKEGAIIVMHDAAERDDREPAAVKALPAILDAMARLGLSARTVALPPDSRERLPALEKE